MSVLCLVELDGADASLRSLTLARSVGDVNAVVFASAAPQDTVARYGVTRVYLIEPSSLEGYAPQAWARALAGLAAETGATAVLAAGTDWGNEVLEHLGAITGLPMAANCTLVTPDGSKTHRLVRHRWAGRLADLLEEHPDAEADLRVLVQEIQAALPAGMVSAADHAVAAGRDVNISADRGSFAAGNVHGDVTLPGPSDPGPAGG